MATLLAASRCFLLPLLLLCLTHNGQVSAQMGTVQTALFDYIKQMTGSQPPASTNTNAATTNTETNTNTITNANTNTNTNPADGSGFGGMYSQLMPSASQPAPSAPATEAPAAAPAQSGGSSFLDMYQKMMGAAQQPAPAATTAAPQPGGGSPNGFYGQLMQMMNQPPQAQTQTQSPGLPLDPFGAPPSASPPPAPTTTPGPKLLPFVPPEWNLPKPQTQAQSTWGSGPSHGTTGWGHRTAHRGPTAWEQYYYPNHQNPHPAHHGPASPQPASHPMSNMMMMPRVREMITKQATQFGDLAYYQQHGCIDPTPTAPGPGGIRPTQTLWYGCSSPVSRMVCMRAGKASGGKTGRMAMIMSMMNPSLTRMMEKCLSPKMMTRMLFQGFGGGGAGGMNPMLMMAMGGGGGGGGGGGAASLMPMMMMMMSQQNQQVPPPGPAPTGAGFTNAPAGKGVYKDPAGANMLVSQAARIPFGAAQPAQASPANPFLSALGSMFGMGGGSQTPAPAPSNLPNGAAAPGATASPSAAAGGHGPGQGLGPVEPDCSMLMPLMMSKMMAAGEGLNSPEAMEAIGEMRKQFLPFSCQELRIKYTGLPLRLCCPGRVDQPSIFDLFKAKSAGGA